ncbi:FMRFamide neuropeptides-like [Scylla paramamosain]|nr:FLRFamide [Scylla paramamosain]
MIAVAWVLLSGVAWCLASPLTPVPGAIEASPSTHNAPGSDIPEIPQEKRLLKYFLPSSSSWMPTQQEGSKRGYSKNYLRFGRSEEDKRGGRNFLRFGRADISSIEDTDMLPETEDSLEKRNRNFLRFGRDRNFLRFGRSDAEEFGLPGGPLAFSNLQEDDTEDYPVEEKRSGHRNYLRFGRGNRNFLRFGRDDSRNFLRFGRSVDRQLKEQKAHEAPLAPTVVPHSPAKTQDSHRSKRSASPYNYVVMPSHGPAAWAQDFQPDQEDEDLDMAIDGPEGAVSKRGYNRSFLRFGRDRNFLRFGKRNDDSASDVVVVEPASYPRYQRAPQRNFLRFG